VAGCVYNRLALFLESRKEEKPSDRKERTARIAEGV
jgi:hypothetical protein